MNRPPRPVIQPNLILEPTAEGGHRVHIPNGPTANLPGNVLAILSLCDGERSVEDVVVQLYVAGVRVAPESVANLLAQLSDVGLLELAPEAEVHVTSRNNPQTRCLACGRSCEGHRVGPLSPERVESLRALHKELSKDHPRMVDQPPTVTGRLADGTELEFLNFPKQQCVFLGEDRLCMLHARWGPDAKPDICNRFPVTSALAGNEIRIGIKPFCYRLHQTFDDGDPVEPTAALLDEAKPRQPTMPPSPDAAQRLMAQAQEVELLERFTDPSLTLEGLLCSAIGLAPRPELGPEGFRAVGDAAHRVVEFLETHRKATDWTEHGQMLLSWRAALEEAPTWEPPTVAAFALPDRWWRFARFGLEQAVFLRETYRFPSVGSGVLALAIGVLMARWWSLQEDAPEEAYNRFGERVTTWFRLLTASQAFVTLFPDEDAVIALGEAIEG